MNYEAAQTNRLGDRPTNQDRHAVLESDACVLAVVADGMGGHAGGELAAQTVIDTFARSFRESHKPIDDPGAYLQRLIGLAHERVQELARKRGLDPRTTCVTCLIQDGRCWWAHVGDSRLYLVQDGGVAQRTRDHTYVEELYQRGVIGPEETQQHPMRNYVTECVGGEGISPYISLGPETALATGDTLVLCSDGLWSAVSEERMLALLAERPLAEAIDAMAAEAEMQSYPNADNVTVTALRWHAPTAPETADTPGASEPGSRRNSLQSAIAEIRRALNEYGDEMDIDDDGSSQD